MKRKIEVSAVTIENENCYFFAAEFNALYIKNICTGETIYCGAVPWEKQDSELYRGIEYVDGKVYLIPYKARSIAVYDIDKKIFSKITLDERRGATGRFLFKACFKNKKNIYAFGVYAHIIIVIDTVDNSVKYISDWFGKVSSFLTTPQGLLSRKQIAYADGKVFLPLFYGNVMISLNIETESVKTYILEIGGKGYTGICSSGSKIYIAGKDKGIFAVWDGNTGVFKECGKVSIEDVKDTLCLVNYNDRILVLKSDERGINLESSTIDEIPGRYECVGSELYENYFWDKDRGEVIVYSKNNKKRYSLDIEMTECEYESRFLNRNVVKEYRYYGLNEFIEDVEKYEV